MITNLGVYVVHKGSDEGTTNDTLDDQEDKLDLVDGDRVVYIFLCGWKADEFVKRGERDWSRPTVDNEVVVIITDLDNNVECAEKGVEEARDVGAAKCDRLPVRPGVTTENNVESSFVSNDGTNQHNSSFPAPG